MKRLTIAGLLLIGLFFGAGIANATDLDKGWEALEKGDYKTALREFKPLAKEGDVDAQYNLGLMYENGDGVPQDEKQAFKWYRLAAEQGHAEAQYTLDLLHKKGRSAYSRNDYKTALRKLKPFAEQGDAAAQNIFGVMYANGKGVPQDYKQAFKWYRLAADQGLAEAQINLGAMYALGQGVPQDNIRAHMWFNIAATAENDKVKEIRDLFEKRMSKADIALAQKRASQCVKSNYKNC